MRTKITLLLITLLCCLSCRTLEKSANSTNASKADTSLSQQDEKKSSGDVSAAISGKTETETNRNEKQSGGSAQLSPPDSTGKQHPIFINWYNNEIVETSKITAEIEAIFQEKFETLENQYTELNEKYEAILKEKTVSKTGFTFLEKIGIGALALNVLMFVITIFIWRLKLKK